jgi:hypothetical protein
MKSGKVVLDPDGGHRFSIHRSEDVDLVNVLEPPSSRRHPEHSPRCVPEHLNQATTRSPSAINSTGSVSKSGNALRNGLTHRLAISANSPAAISSRTSRLCSWTTSRTSRKTNNLFSSADTKTRSGQAQRRVPKSACRHGPMSRWGQIESAPVPPNTLASSTTRTPTRALRLALLGISSPGRAAVTGRRASALTYRRAGAGASRVVAAAATNDETGRVMLLTRAESCSCSARRRGLNWQGL